MSSSFHSNAAGARAALMRNAMHAAEAMGTTLRDNIVDGMASAPPRTGREYPVPGTRQHYTASGPGEQPAEREHVYSSRWQVMAPVFDGHTVLGGAVNDARTEDGAHFVGQLLEEGTEEMEPRPHVRPALERTVAEWRGHLA